MRSHIHHTLTIDSILFFFLLLLLLLSFFGSLRWFCSFVFNRVLYALMKHISGNNFIKRVISNLFAFNSFRIYVPIDIQQDGAINIIICICTATSPATAFMWWWCARRTLTKWKWSKLITNQVYMRIHSDARSANSFSIECVFSQNRKFNRSLSAGN